MPFAYLLEASTGQSAATLLAFAVLPIAKVFIMCALGLLMATSYIGILTAPARKQLTKLVFSVFLPALIFTELGKAVTLEKLLQWWFIPVNIVVASITGCSIGYLVALLIKPPKKFFNFTFIMIGIGNIGNIPLVIIGAICRDSSNPFGDAETCNSNGVAYISFGQWVGAVIVYTIVYELLAPPDLVSEDESADCEKANDEPVEHQSGEPDSEISSQVQKDDEARTPLLQNSEKTLRVKAWVNACMTTLRVRDILQPPVVASILAILIGASSTLKGLIFEEQSPLFFLYDALSIVGGAMVPCVMLALGGNLINGAASSELGLKTTVAITFTRLLIIPCFGLGVVTLADKLGFLPPDDKMFRFVLLLQHTMPTSILAGAITNLRGFAEKEAAAILFYEHVLAVVSMAGWLLFYLNYLF